MTGRLTVSAAIAVAILAVSVAGCSSPAPALTDRDTLLIADFSNATGDAALDDALKPAATLMLQQTPFLTIVPDQRVQRVLRAMQRPADDPVAGDTGREICKRAGARAMLEGSAATSGSQVMVTLAVIDCQSGAALAKEEVRAAGKDQVLAQLGAGLKNLRRRLGEPSPTLQKYDAPVAEAMTGSIDAMREFGLGLRARATRGDEASVPFFIQAVGRDVNFAVAYAKLAVVTGNIGRIDEARDYTKKAWDLRARMTEYERLYIDWNYASRVQQDQAAVKASLERLTSTYPRDFAARNNFGVYYNGAGEYDEALRQYRAASEIAPDEPGPISNAAYVLITLGRYDEASEAVDRALAIRPDPGLALARWIAARLAGLPRAPEFERVARSLAPPDQMATVEASLAAWAGRFAEFDRMQSALVARAKASGNPDAAAGAATGRLMTLAVYRGGRDLDALKAAAAREKNPALLAQQLSVLALVGDLDAVRSGLARLGADMPGNAMLASALLVPRAYLQAKDGQTAAAIASLQAGLAAAPRLRDFNYFIADLREQSGDLDGAAAAYRIVTTSVTFIGTNPIIPLSRLKLAKLLLKRGDRNGAVEQLDALLAQWKDADGDFMVLSEVKKLRAQIGQ
jgi:eukaryotic-like serine/threonine-protein kinase